MESTISVGRNVRLLALDIRAAVVPFSVARFVILSATLIPSKEMYHEPVLLVVLGVTKDILVALVMFAIHRGSYSLIENSPPTEPSVSLDLSRESPTKFDKDALSAKMLARGGKADVPVKLDTAANEEVSIAWYIREELSSPRPNTPTDNGFGAKVGFCTDNAIRSSYHNVMEKVPRRR